jgi:hypothetical protein
VGAPVGVTEGVSEAEGDEDAEGHPEDEGDSPMERLAEGLAALRVGDGVAVPVEVSVPEPVGVGVGDPLGVPEFDGVPLLLPVALGVTEGLAPLDSEGEGVADIVGVRDGVEVGVESGVLVGVAVAMPVAVGVGVRLAEVEGEPESEPEGGADAPLERLAVAEAAVADAVGD